MKLLYTIWKEGLLLARDRGGLALLFIMPTALVLIVTLVQEDAFKKVKGSTIAILLVDRDKGEFARGLEKGFASAGEFKVEKEFGGKPLSEEEGRLAVARGDRPVCVVIPEGVSDGINRGAEERLRQMVLGGGGEKPGTSEIVVYFDPVVRDSFSKSVIGALEQVSQAVEIRMLFNKISQFAAASVPGGGAKTAWEPSRIVAIREVFAGQAETIPTSVQQNVPAWTLFAMFLIVIPLSGSIIKEREGGTLVRLRTLPVSYWTILTGKVAVYVVVCLLQCGFMLAMGTWIMPWMGLPHLEMGSNYPAILIAAVASALAATGFGIMTGTLARTHDQASVFGSTFVVIAGALGGVMVPVFLMPPGMRAISVWSPLNWGLNAFLNIFLRGGALATILPDVLRLLAFFVGTMLVAMLSFVRRD